MSPGGNRHFINWGEGRECVGLMSEKILKKRRPRNHSGQVTWYKNSGIHSPSLCESNMMTACSEKTTKQEVNTYFTQQTNNCECRTENKSNIY